MTENRGRPLGSRYHIGALIGRGGMGEVWRGTDETGAAVAVKTLQPQFAEDPGVVQRFVAERHLLTSARDPHVVRVRDLVAEGSTLAIVMDLVEGPDLRAHLTGRGTLTSAEACRLGAQVARGLAAIHAARIVHRDVKPENVLLDQTVDPPRAMLTDFGVSKLLEESPAHARATVVAGTPLYLAPEVALGATPSPRSDLYSLGIVLYELLCGVTPFAGMAPGAILHAQTSLDPGRPDGLDDRLWNLLAQLMSKDPAQRPGDAAAIAKHLDRLAQDLAGRGELAPLTVPPSPVPAAPYRVSPGGPVVAATQVGAPQPSPAPSWDTPTTLGLPGGQAGYPTPGGAPMPAYPGQGYGGAASMPGQMSSPAGYPAGPPPTQRKRSWLLPVVLGGLALVVIATVAGWMIGNRDQTIVAAPLASTEPSAQPSPSQTPTPTPAAETPSAAPLPVAAAPTRAPDQEVTGSLPSGPGAYADGFVRAWGIGDSQDASRYATDSAVSSLFQYDGRGGGSWARQSSAVQGGRTQVRYTDGSGASLYVVVDTAVAGRGAPDAIVGANVEWDDIDNTYDGEFDYGPTLPDEPAVATGLETTTGEYADALVRAWGAGDRSAADPYATDTALASLFIANGTGGPTWQRTGSTSSTAVYVNDDGTGLLLELDPAAVSAGRGDAVYAATFGG